MKRARIVIVGGGAAGLSCAGALAHHGLKSVILDASERVGKTWADRYERLHLHTIRGLSHCAYSRLPDHLPRYVSKTAFAQYLQTYAEQIDVDIRHGIEAQRITRSDDNLWHIQTNDEDWFAEHVIVATGFNRVPFTPSFPGHDLYEGDFLHSAQYSTGQFYKGLRALVIGSGNSGTEICADLVEQGASYVAISVRTPPMIVPRDPLGIPVQVWGFPLSMLPAAIADRLAAFIGRWRLGNLCSYGMEKPAWGIFSDGRIPTIDVGFVSHLKAGKIHIKPTVAALSPDGVVYDDGTLEMYDVIVAATGYRTGLERIIDVPGIVDDDGQLTVSCGEPTPHTGLYFVGLENSPAGILTAARIQSRKVAAYISAQYTDQPPFPHPIRSDNAAAN